MKINRPVAVITALSISTIAAILAFTPFTPSYDKPEFTRTSNNQTQLNHLSSITISKSAIVQAGKLVVNGPDGHQIKAFTFILDPKIGSTYVSSQQTTVLPEHIMTRIISAKSGDRIIIDRVTSIKTGDTLYLSPALYEITD